MKVKLVDAGEFGPLYMEYVPDEPQQDVIIEISCGNENQQSRLRPVIEVPTMFEIARRFPDSKLEITKVDGGHIIRVKDIQNTTTDLSTYRAMSSGFFVGDVYFNNPYKITKT